MWWKRRQLSDAEFVERFRESTPARRKAGAICLVFSLLMWGMVLYGLEMITSGKWTIDDDPAEQLAFRMGAMLGTTAMMALGGATWFFCLAICLHFPDRKEELLLEYHRRLAELNQLPVGSE